MWRDKKGSFAMPTDVAIAVTAIVVAFGVFAAALAWADHYSRDVRRTQAGE